VSQTLYAAAGVAVSKDDTNITAARICLSAQEKTEVVVTVCSDAAGAPGKPLGKPSVLKLAPGPAKWIVFDLPAPLTAESDNLWLTMRTNLGSLLWFMDNAADGSPLISTDSGRSWGSPDTPLNDNQKLLAQLWIDTGPPIRSSSPPVLRLERDGVALASNLLAGAQPGSPGEFKASVSFPQPALSAVAANGDKVNKHFQLVSPAVADVVLEGFELTFDPAT
jgi:hypothetical protein